MPYLATPSAGMALTFRLGLITPHQPPPHTKHPPHTHQHPQQPPPPTWAVSTMHIRNTLRLTHITLRSDVPTRAVDAARLVAPPTMPKAYTNQGHVRPLSPESSSP